MSLLRSWLQKPTETSPVWPATRGPPSSPPPLTANTPDQELEDMHSTIASSLRHASPSPSPSSSSPFPTHTRTIHPAPRPRPPPPSTLRAIARKEAELQTQLQTLLDAQADALVAGLAGPSTTSSSLSLSLSPSRSQGHSKSHSQSGATSARSGTSNASPRRAPGPSPRGAVPIRQPPAAAPPSLRATRRALAQTMGALSAVKSNEGAELEVAAAANGAALAQARGWAAKRAGLKAAVARLEGGAEGERAQADALGAEEAALAAEIEGLQARLEELRARLRSVRRARESVGNKVQARVSSYRASLELVERDVRRFLDAPVAPGLEVGLGLGTAAAAATSASVSTSVSEGYLALVPGRRTLGLALEYLEEQGGGLRVARERVDEEREALDEGVVVWKDVVDEVSAAERHLHREMPKMVSASMSSTVMPARGRAGFEEQGSSDLGGLIVRMDETITTVESKLKLAEARGWNLLVCCIGAELEAFKQGRQLLWDAAGGGDGKASDYSEQQQREVLDDAGQEEIRVDDYSPGGSPVTRRGPFASRGRAQSSDDEPDPDMLVSRDTDTESSV